MEIRLLGLKSDPGHQRPARGIGAGPVGSGPGRLLGLFSLCQSAGSHIRARGGLCAACCGRDPGGQAQALPPPVRAWPSSLAQLLGSLSWLRVRAVSHAVVLLRSPSTVGN